MFCRLRTYSRCIVLIAFLVFAAAASQGQQAHPDPAELSVDDLPSEAGSLDIDFLRLNLVIPSFSGMYWQDGTLRVLLQNVSDAEAARPAILKYLHINYASDSKDKLPEIRFEKPKSELTWLQVYHYKIALRDVLAIEATVFLDADEVCGCVTIGISNERARGAVENFIRIAGVPENAARIQLVPAAIPLQQDVTNVFRPVVGGVQIKNDAGPFAFLGFSEICTATIVGTRAGVLGFVTASHCTRVQGGVEGTSFYQNGRNLFSTDYVGHETADPVWTVMPGCPTGRQCRLSDSAFVMFDIPSPNGAANVIAKPSTLCVTAPVCPLALPNPKSALTLTGTGAAPMVGSLVTKVGRTTGWTGGTVTATCVNTTEAGSNFVALCSTFAAAGSQGGDSGSPVFTIPPGSGSASTSATLVGILWGGSATNTSMIFSPISAVTAELGATLFFPPQAPPPPPPPPQPGSCSAGCSAGRSSCMEHLGGPDHITPRDCVSDYRECLVECRRSQR